MIVFYNQDDVTASLESSRLLKEGQALVLADENTFTALFSSGQVTHAVYVTMVPNVGYLTYALNLDNSQPLTTAGLLGIRMETTQTISPTPTATVFHLTHQTR